MRNEICYEWAIEYVDEYGDIQDIHFEDVGGLSILLRSVEFGERRCDDYDWLPRLVVVYNLGNEHEGLVERHYCYLVDGELDTHFRETCGTPMRKVPQRLKTEFIKAVAQSNTVPT